MYAVRMSESYDTRCRVGARQIVAPIGAGEARIPALVRLHDERLILFFDERPAPASGTGADFNGLTMASDLPNPNRIRWMERDGRGGWSDPRVVVGLGEGAFGYSDCQLLGAEAVVVFERERGLWEVSCFPERCSAWAPARSSKFIAARAGAPGQRPSMMAMRGS